MNRSLSFFVLKFFWAPFLFEEKVLSLHFFLYYSISKNKAPSRSKSSPRGATKSMA